MEHADKENIFVFIFLVVFCNTKLNKGEIIGLSRAVGMDWDGLAGLMNIQYRVREEINFDTKYPSFSCKAEEIFALFNNVECFGRCSLQKFFKELRRHDLEEKMLDFKKGGCCKVLYYCIYLIHPELEITEDLRSIVVT